MPCQVTLKPAAPKGDGRGTRAYARGLRLGCGSYRSGLSRLALLVLHERAEANDDGRHERGDRCGYLNGRVPAQRRADVDGDGDECSYGGGGGGVRVCLYG